ncbi:CoA transferase [Burkholderia pseudomultivorans]|uniref:CaiB/BaiF CoA transferase family protein n=1 Tax=Burkholderia pseudomultivorans TaxID=1207504 RepID=UPI0001FDB540|nr:CaiB/BaiF CoA-transferase family protein [Burkholderia pseudomultivorans]EGD02235.1 L-carnitine dehydratase/bile acid-inducible protein F [Burkholderia sp. TJI49]AOI90534.1 formyl-CoA transferase [Burkholderia pseudomultivorans]KVC23393.1 formyl-CoA transferase [Burkholderia pseudomultivorans]KVC36762.1 formyl-CoA transferase [Burkholderia pseudomultivorans]KWE99365.1 formyl-CoA transferase [Burkholderia pseudomultivorans]
MSAARPLEGIRVLDLTVALAGPYGSLLLGGMGAEVIRIESPGGGDIARNNPPYVGKDGVHFGVKGDDEVSLTVLNRARNKKSITLDLKSAQGKALFMELVKESDVVIENASEGVTARLGVDYDSVREVNPKIIYASIKAFGEPSPYKNLKGMDIIVQALSGIMDVTGFADGPPTRSGLPIADLIAPLYAVNGILAALIHRGRTGVGQCVQVSMLDCLSSLVAEEHFDVFLKHGYSKRSGNFQDRLVPFGVYGTRDGHVAMVAFQPDWFRNLMEAVGRPEMVTDPRYATRGPRMKHAAEINAIIEAWTSRHSTAEVVEELQVRRGVPAAPVRSPLDVLKDPVLQERGAVVRLEHPGLADVDAMGMGLPIKLSQTPVQFDQPAQELGAANDEIYRGLLKLPEDRLQQLRDEGVI